MIFAGYFTAPAVSDYLPAVRRAWLVERATAEVLHAEIDGYQLYGAKVVSIAPAPKYRFANLAGRTAALSVAAKTSGPAWCGSQRKSPIIAAPVGEVHVTSKAYSLRKGGER